VTEVSSSRSAVVVFACDPRIEAARKPFLGGRSATLHAAMLADTVERLRSSAGDLILAWRGEESRAWALRPHALVHQRGKTFGERLAQAGRDVVALGYGRIALVAADCPRLTAAEVDGALARLERREVVVIGPAPDGGVYLFAYPAPLAARLGEESLPWGTSELSEALRRRLDELGIAAELLEEREDIDTVESLTRVLRSAPDSRLARLIRRSLPTGLSFLSQGEASETTPLLVLRSPFPRPGSRRRS